jgi:hypothetical protein
MKMEDRSVPDHTNLAQCPYCGKHFKQKGLKIHISKAHPEISRQRLVETYSLREEPAEVDATTAEATNEISPNRISKELLAVFHSLDKLAADFDVLSQNWNAENCDELVDSLTKLLVESASALPGPKHPAVKFYKLRKSKLYKKNDKTYATSSNPERASKRQRERRNEKYQYNLMQYLFHNERKKCVNKVMNNASKVCKIPMNVLHESFSVRWGSENTKTRQSYGAQQPEEYQTELDMEFDISVSIKEVENTVKRMKADSSPGPDRVLIRTLKFLPCKAVLAKLITLMLMRNYVPKSFREARTVLIYKSGDETDPSNWRPISVCSMLRRVAERVIESRLRPYLELSSNQRGFTSIPGTHVNASILNACLKKSKSMKKDLVIVFLDVVKAFDNVGHSHLEQTLNHLPIPSLLKNVVLNLLTQNFTRIYSGGSSTKPIFMKQGLFQGSPLSPMLFNVAIDFILQTLNENEMSQKFGFPLVQHLSNIIAESFADDTALIANSRSAAAEITLMTRLLFSEIGLELNNHKSMAICMDKGKLSEVDLNVDETTNFKALGRSETIRYLGITIHDEVILDQPHVIKNLSEKLENLVSITVLRPDQKLSIINQYIWPTLVYPLQCAPLNKIPKSFLQDIDKIVRSAVKEILMIPSDTPNAMLYSSPSNKGLGIFKASWEAYIQNYSICHTLSLLNCPYLPLIRSLEEEMAQSLKKLDVDPEAFAEEVSHSKEKRSKLLRARARNREFSNWSLLPSKGKGVSLYDECPKVNRSLMSKQGLSSSEWISYLKMVGDVVAVRAIPGRTRSQDNRCRHCNEYETLSHVLGSCEHGNLLRNSRHHRIRTSIANAFRNRGLSVYEEVHCNSDDGSNRRVDIIAFDEESRNGFIVDPTVRIESSEDQPEDVNLEKKGIYNPCLPDLREKYNLMSLEVTGIFVGARGTITKFFQAFCKEHKLPKQLLEDVAIIAVKGSHQILTNHLYPQNTR